MKAIVYERFGAPDVLKVKDIEKPIPKSNEVLIKIKATSVTRYEIWARSQNMHTGLSFFMKLWFGFKKPKFPILGTELSGVIESTGKKVIDFKPGDEVFAYSGTYLGAYAEYICIDQDVVAKKPKNQNFQEAAAVLQGALTALYFLREANIQREQKVLILGASGGVGNFAVQIARNYYGANVTGVCSTSKKEFVQSIGADKVIDYTKEDILKCNETFDVIFDTFAKTDASYNKLLKKGGTFLYATFGLKQIINILRLKLFSNKKAKSPLLKESKEDILKIKQLIEEGKLKANVDKSFSFDAAAAAHQYFESEKKKGQVIINISN